MKQAFVNLIVNAAQAIKARAEKQEGFQGIIILRTRNHGSHVEVEISDNGTGISKEIRDRIFQQFFTTKPPGVGTGQGLPLVRKIIEEKHHGKIQFESRENVGTTFRIILPAVGEER